MKPSYPQAPSAGRGLPGQRGGPAPAPGLYAQYPPTNLLVEEDWTLRFRRRLGLAVGLAAAVLLLAAVHCLVTGGHGLLWIGLSRLSRVAAEHGMPGTHLFAALEHVLGAAGLAWLSACLLFGETTRVRPQTGQRLIYHRRQVWRRLAPSLALGGVLLLLGLFLAAAGQSILASLVEIPGWALFGAALWRLSLPEARTSLTCIVDANRGWGNHLLITGGIFNKGTIVIRHDVFKEAQVIAVGWQRIFRAADLRLVWRDQHGGHQALLVRGAGTPAELNQLVGYLYGSFGLSLNTQALQTPRLPPFNPHQI